MRELPEDFPRGGRQGGEHDLRVVDEGSLERGSHFPNRPLLVPSHLPIYPPVYALVPRHVVRVRSEVGQQVREPRHLGDGSVAILVALQHLRYDRQVLLDPRVDLLAGFHVVTLRRDRPGFRGRLRALHELALFVSDEVIGVGHELGVPAVLGVPSLAVKLLTVGSAHLDQVLHPLRRRHRAHRVADDRIRRGDSHNLGSVRITVELVELPADDSLE